MARTGLLILLILLASQLVAQQDSVTADYRRWETRDLGFYRIRVSHTNPYHTLPADPQVNQAPLGGDSTRRRVPPKLEMPSAVQRLLRMRETENNNTIEVDGFRVQVYSGSSRDRAAGIRGQLSIDFGQYQGYQFYDRPFFKVRIGDFYSKLEAEALCAEIRKKIPGAFVVPDKVRLPE